MSAHLVIHDSAPPWWWESTDIWVVPGSDPNGLPGSPTAGITAYVWVRVSNVGNATANGTRVDFYWANPSAQMVVGMATKIGSAFVDLAPSETKEVLCLVPWIPVIVNNGHECLLAVAHGSGDTNPIPDPLPNSYPFDPPVHDQIAQLNLGVLQAPPLGMSLTLTVNAIGRVDKRAVVAVEFGEAVDERTLANLGLRDLRLAKERHVQVSLSREPLCYEKPDPYGKGELEVYVKRGTSVPVFVSLHARQLPRGEYQLVRVVERSGDKLLGGVSYLVVNTQETETKTETGE